MVKSVESANFEGKRVFVRVDFNVPLKDGIVTDDTRIREAIKTIEFIKEKKGKVILASHLGRPKGEFKKEFSLNPVADYINSNFFKVKFVDDCIGEKVVNAVNELKNGEILLLENLRFYKGEEKNLDDFCDELKKITDVYVNDAFGTSHRKHASVYGLPRRVEEKYAGFLLQKEVNYFEKLLQSPDRPFGAILGGAKVSDKIGVIESLINLVDKIFIGGAMAYTFLKYKGYSIGKSLVEDEQLETVKNIYKKAEEEGVEIFTPVDHVCSAEFCGEKEIINDVNIPDNLMGLDIGEKTIELYRSQLSKCKTVLWNGPMGVFEDERYSKGTFEIANLLANIDAVVVVGGGDSVSAVKKTGADKKLSHVSTGGGASLEYIELGHLPGIDVLKE
ncbi:MAG: phosphoglycerate kinase [Deferribacteraceae bacterium]|jgi:phosphoglycerate kinase|nr:phosphoglycerate kinase [Deferribacteraceae bacterium]